MFCGCAGVYLWVCVCVGGGGGCFVGVRVCICGCAGVCVSFVGMCMGVDFVSFALTEE